VRIQPKPGDPNDYVAVRNRDGRMFAVTNTCAANVLDLTKPGDYAHGNPAAGRKAMEPIAEELGVPVEEAARDILEVSSTKIVALIQTLMAEYKQLEEPVLVGGGGGAAVLIPFVAKRTKLEYRISENAEVISSIGVALAMTQEVVERIIPFAQPEDLLKIKKEAQEAAISNGAPPETVTVYIEIDPQTQKVRATALESTELKMRPLSRRITLNDAKSIAATSLKGDTKLVGTTGALYVFSGPEQETKFKILETSRRPFVIVDQEGFVKLKRSNGLCAETRVRDALAKLEEIWDQASIYASYYIAYPDLYLVVGGRILDFVGMRDLRYVKSLVASQLEGLNKEEMVIVIGVPSPLM
jgi:N-methylhydantoinase A